MRRVVIAGGGISGLATAYYLAKAGVPATIVEPGAPGGLLQTERIEGCVVEAGPDSFLTAKPWARELIEELGLGGQLIGSLDHQRATLIWRGGKLERLPEGMVMMAPRRLGPFLRSPLLGVASKLRALRELAWRPATLPDRSISDFVRDHFGPEVVDYIAEPLLAGVYGGDPRELSAAGVIPQIFDWEARHGSLIRGARREVPRSSAPLFTTLRDGLGVLPRALCEAAKLELIRGRVEKIEAGWRVRVDGDWLDAAHIVVACRPRDVLPGLLPEFRYSSATVVALGYRAEDVRHPMNGFGFLVPRVERKILAACTWVGRKFAHRVPEGKVLLRCFVPGGGASGLGEELREKMGITADPLFTRTWQWPDSMPQYAVGHREAMRYVDEMLKNYSGLHVCGNAYRGVGIPDCIRMAKEVAGRIAAASA